MTLHWLGILRYINIIHFHLVLIILLIILVLLILLSSSSAWLRILYHILTDHNIIIIVHFYILSLVSIAILPILAISPILQGI